MEFRQPITAHSLHRWSGPASLHSLSPLQGGQPPQRRMCHCTLTVTHQGICSPASQGHKMSPIRTMIPRCKYDLHSLEQREIPVPRSLLLSTHLRIMPIKLPCKGVTHTPPDSGFKPASSIKRWTTCIRPASEQLCHLLCCILWVHVRMVSAALQCHTRTHHRDHWVWIQWSRWCVLVLHQRLSQS